MKLKISLLALLLAASAGAQAQNTLRIGLAEDPDVLDPTLARTYVGRIVFASLCDKLFDIDDKLNLVPQLALSHQVSADGKAVTIKLRPNVKFHDGEPFNAEAAKFSLERHLNMTGSFRKAEIAQVDKVEVVDPLTVRLLLKAPFAPLVAQLTDRAGMMVSPKAAQALGDKFGTAPVCAGPYKFVERVPQDRIVVERFGDYWDKGKVHIDRIVYRPIQDSTVRLANLKSGQLDMLERLLATDVEEVKKDSRLRLATGTELGYQGLTVNIANGEKANNPLGKNPKVRQAFELALDRDAINQVVFNGLHEDRQPVGQPGEPVPPRQVPDAQARRRQGQGADQGSRRRDADRRRLHGAQQPGEPRGRRGHAVDGQRSRLRPQDPRDRVRDLAQRRREGQLPALLPRLERPHRPGRQHLLVRQLQRPAQLRQVLRSEGRRAADQGAHRDDDGRAQGAVRAGRGGDPAQGRRSSTCITAPCCSRTARELQGYKVMPDGLIRVTDLKLAPQ